MEFSQEEILGEQLFYTHPEPLEGIRGANCGDCHSGPLTTNRLFSNNGLESPIIDLGREDVTNNSLDKGKFKIPTLRNIELTAPYMHNGIFKTSIGI